MRLATQSPTRAPSAPRSGLLTSRGAIPLRRTRVQAWITGPCARVTLTQSFHNTHPEPIEAVYAFPLPPEAAITAFEATIGPRTVQGHIQERQEAFDQYDDALADGHGAFLLEQHRPDVFTVSLGILTILLGLTGLDPVTALSGAATALANIGPGLGDTIGPSGNFSTLNDTAKWLLSAGMLVGRLELLVVLVLFLPRFWRG